MKLDTTYLAFRGVKEAVLRVIFEVLILWLTGIWFMMPEDPLQPNKWCYTGLQGVLIFTLDESDGLMSFQVGRLGGC